MIPTTASAALLLANAVPLVHAALYNQVIHTQYGDLVGYPAFNSSPAGYDWNNWQDIAEFKGIPFAATTGGANRWRQPQPVEPWNTTLYADTFGPVCPGSSENTSYVFSEDCLNLNIWTPARSANERLPVVMWSYPALSTARDDLFNGGGMAHKGVVFVSYNYRALALGLLATPELSEEFEAVTGHNVSGNWALYDQFAALKWIRENIQDFGGDPDHITVMGQSAGSAATYHILNSELTKGEIVGAIIESGVRDPHDPLVPTLAEQYGTLSANLAQGVEFLQTVLNVSSIEQARALSYETIEAAETAYTWLPTLDYYAMPGTYLDSLVDGLHHNVPVLTGNTKDESGATYGLNMTVPQYYGNFSEVFNGTWLQRFLELYPADNDFEAAGAYNSLWTDRSKIGTYFWSQIWTIASKQPVYNYFWDHAPPGQTRGAYHESEINYVLNNLYDTDLPWQAADYVIANTMNDYWVNFIKTGNPNGDGLVYWPPATEGKTSLVQRVGNAFEQIPIADPAKAQLNQEWFATLKAY